MKKLLVILALTTAVYLQVPPPAPPSVEVGICAAGVYTETTIGDALAEAVAQGCTDVRLSYLGQGQWTAYGVRVSVEVTK